MKRLLVAWCALTALVAVGVLFASPPPAPNAPPVAARPSRPVLAVSAHDDGSGGPSTRPADADGELDFGARTDAALHIADPAARQRALVAILGRWLATDPEGLLKYLMAAEVENDGTKLDSLASALRAALDGADPKLAAASAAQEAIRRMVLYLARFDPDAALAFATRWLEEDSREAVSVPIARALAQRDPREGLDLARRLGSPLRRMQAFAAVGAVWAQTDPAARSPGRRRCRRPPPPWP
jgi:hypothetical protein